MVPRAMKKYALLAAALAAAAILPAVLVVRLRASATADPVANGRSEFAAKNGAGDTDGLQVDRSVVDLGDCPATGFESGEFVLSNMSRQVIVIDNIRPSCGCTTVDFSTKEIPPGGSLHIPVHVDLSAIIGEFFEKQVTVTIGPSTSTKELVIPIKGRIAASGMLVAIPGAVDFGSVAASQEVRRRIHLRGSSRVIESLPERFVIDGASLNLSITVAPSTKDAEAWASVDLILRHPKALEDLTGGPPAVSIRDRSGRLLCRIPIRVQTVQTKTDGDSS
jgi:hypothetical protein